MNKLQNTFLLSLGLFFILISIGTTGYLLLTPMDFLQALYMTVISVTTVGYGEITDLSGHPDARIFTMFLLFSGMGITAYFVSNLTAFFVEGELTDILRRRKMEKQIEKLNDHVIVVGGGQTAFYGINEMMQYRQPFVVIERDVKAFDYLCSHFPHQHILGIVGDSTEDEILIKAGIQQASGLITTLPDDKDNLFVTISARGLNPKIRIITKVVHTSSTGKLQRAGADYVVCPDSIGGLRMASTMLRPVTVSFLDIMLREREHNMRIDEVQLGNRLKGGNNIASLNLPQRFGNMLLLAIKPRQATSFIYNPGHEMPVNEGDTLIVLATTDYILQARQELGTMGT